MPSGNRYCYASARLDMSAEFEDARLEAFTERHQIALKVPALEPAADIMARARSSGATGVVVEMAHGWPSRAHLRLTGRLLSGNLRVWFYWPHETAIECIDRERLGSYWRLWLVTHAALAWSIAKPRLRPYYHAARRIARRLLQAIGMSGSPGATAATDQSTQNEPSRDTAARLRQEAEQLAASATPVPFSAFGQREPGQLALRGTGVYLRTDFWAKISSGGSYGHTCYVAKALADLTDGFVCFMASRFALLDDMGLRQVILDPPGTETNEATLLKATDHDYAQLRVALEALRPAYIYERLILGNMVGAKLSRDLGIPYLLEYNGSEISMSKSFGGTGFAYEDTYLAMEAAAFRQATAISVVSSPVMDDLVRRGIDPARILVNPNGVDIDVYCPAHPDEKAAIRAEFGFSASDRVIGFIGTFGGWHGIDILAASLNAVCERVPDARFLLIGNGNFRHLVDEVILKHRLGDRVRCVGTVPQQEGARLLKACDIYVSPHNSHMVDSRFFGSPTKMFEYMAMGGGIVASDLEQLGEVLSPALRATDLPQDAAAITDQRSVLCTPGSVEEFVEGIVYLAGRPDACRRLGENARRAAASDFTWDGHVAKLLRFVQAGTAAPAAAPPVPASTNGAALDAAAQPALAPTAGGDGPAAPPRIETGDDYKNEVQNQWNNDPCGSHYVKNAAPHTLDWFLEAEDYRYREYAPWMHETMEFAQHRGKQVLEIGGGMGTDLAQFARNGAIVTDVDLSAGHLELAKENFRLRGLQGTFVHHDAESLPFPDNAFDVVYSNGVIHHTPNTRAVIAEILRVLKPGGKAIVMVYAENSLVYWRNLVGELGMRQGMLMTNSIGHVMSGNVELSDNGARPLVKVYTPRRIRSFFSEFEQVSVVQRQLTPAEVPRLLKWMSLERIGSLMGWNLVVKARKPGRSR